MFVQMREVCVFRPFISFPAVPCVALFTPLVLYAAMCRHTGVGHSVQCGNGWAAGVHGAVWQAGGLHCAQGDVRRSMRVGEE